MSNESSYYKEIIKKLEKLTKREYALLASLGIQVFILIGVAVFTTFVMLELIGHFSSEIRTVFFFIFLIVFIGSFTFLFLLPLLKHFNLFGRTNYSQAAIKVGMNFPVIKDDLLNAMQLVSPVRQSGIDNKKFYSSNLVDAAFNQVYNKTKDIKFEMIVNFKKAKELLLYSSGVTLFCGILFVFIPDMQAASNRLINFNQEFIPPAKFIFEIKPGNAQITKGENIFITVRTLPTGRQVNGSIPKEVFIAVKDVDQTYFELQQLFPDSIGNYFFERQAVRSSFKYFAEAENIKSNEFTIDVVDRPIIKTFDVTINPPAYAKLPQIKQKDNGNITALIGSVVELELGVTKNLNKAQLAFGDTTSISLSTDGSEVKGKFRIKRDNEYKIILSDENGNQNLSPITYSVKAIYDASPSIDVIEPNKDVSLANDNRLPLYLKISDDYGFTKLLLHYRLSASKYEPPQKDFKSLEIEIQQPDKNQKEADVSYIWNLSQMNLATEDVVSYYLEIFDNDNISGPKSAKSNTFNIRIPSLDELLAKADETHSQAEQELKETLKEAEDLKQTLEKIDQDLKQDKKELTWDEKENIENALEKFEELQNKVDEVNKELEQMKENLQENNLLSKETLEKYMELQKLMDQLTSEEMKKAMEQMQSMLQNLNRQMTQDAMQNLKIDEEKFQKSIERTLNLLKRIQIEQKVDELLKRTEELANKQEEIEKQTKESIPIKSGQKEKDQLSSKQDELTKEMDKMDQEMNDLSEKMESLKDMPKEDMDKIIEEFEKQKNQELSEEASKNIQQNQKQQAQQQQSQLSKNMQKMNQNFQQFQQQIMQQNQMQTFTDMMKILDNLITLSKQQEELRKESQKLEPNSSAFNENAEKQSNLQRNLDKILQQMSDVSQKTFTITPEMGKALGDAKREMQKSMQAMQNRNGNIASLSQGESMKSLNEAATLMKGSMEAMMQNGGQGGMMSLMQQLQQFSQQQMNLNNLTQMFQQGQQGKFTPQQQAELQRLAQQQELIRKSIEQLNKESRESGESKKLPENLENIMKQMQEVVTDMNTQKLDDQLIQKQERILSKLLDAQRSINERDFEKKRESNTGDNIVRESPAELNLSSQDGKNKIKDELSRAVQEGYNKDYENLIRKYFEALQKENVKN